MRPISRRGTLVGLVSTASLLIAAPTHAKSPVYTSFLSNTALKGYDAVAYHTEGKPVQGNKAHSLNWQGAVWHFATAENKAFFEAEPERYAPQYGGYCAWAVSEGYTAPGAPQYWHIENGKLYLNYNEDVQRKWFKDIQGHITSADANWPGVLQ